VHSPDLSVNIEEKSFSGIHREKETLPARKKLFPLRASVRADRNHWGLLQFHDNAFWKTLSKIERYPTRVNTTLCFYGKMTV
jgi:hypothetical protein